MHNFIFEYFTKRRKKNATKEFICIRKKPKIYIPQKIKITKKLSEISKNKLVSTHPENSAHELKFSTNQSYAGWLEGFKFPFNCSYFQSNFFRLNLE